MFANKKNETEEGHKKDKYQKLKTNRQFHNHTEIRQKYVKQILLYSCTGHFAHGKIRMHALLECRYIEMKMFQIEKLKTYFLR